MSFPYGALRQSAGSDSARHPQLGEKGGEHAQLGVLTVAKDRQPPHVPALVRAGAEWEANR